MGVGIFNNKMRGRNEIQEGLEVVENALNLDADGNIQLADDNAIVSDQTYSGSNSFQSVAADLTVDGLGSDDGTDTAFIAPIMGNIHGSDVTGEGNYLAGVIGAIDMPDVASDYPTGAIMGVVMDGVDNIDGAVVAVIDGNDPSSVTLPRAAFAVRMNNNNAGSGATYGLDLHDAGNSHYSGGPIAFNVKNADIRLSSQACLMTGAGAPVNGTTGDNFAGKGSLYIDISNGKLYINTGIITNPTWVVVGSQT